MSNDLENIIVSETDDGQRLDRWLKKHFAGIPFGQMQKILRTGQLRIDGKRAKGEARLVTGQILRIPPALRGIGIKERVGVSPKDTAFIKSLVIYKDDDLIAINKPAGLATQGGSKISRHVDGMLEALCYDSEERPHLVHRLDKDTSGVLLIARSAAAAREMGHLFKSRDIRKYYWAVTVPAPPDVEGKIRSTLAKVEGRGGERMMAVDEDNESGKMALTNYAVVDSLDDRVAWVAFWPRTGRTHQIRVHAAELGCPLLGDYKYGPGLDETVADLMAGQSMAKTLHLHARRLIFDHPRTGARVDITAPLGEEMKKTFGHFGFNHDDKTDHFKDVE